MYYCCCLSYVHLILGDLVHGWPFSPNLKWDILLQDVCEKGGIFLPDIKVELSNELSFLNHLTMPTVKHVLRDHSRDLLKVVS